MFTADLKSFASYGLENGALTPATPESTPKRKRTASTKKTKISAQVVEIATEFDLVVNEGEEVSSLAERVKKRRRVALKK